MVLNIIAMGYHSAFDLFLEKIKNDLEVKVLTVILPFNRSDKLQSTIDTCKKNNYTYHVPKTKKDLQEIFAQFSSIDLIVVSAFMMLIPSSILSLPKKGIINLHASLLPKHRGAHPLNWAIISGDEYTGCTVHYMTEELDKGDIILQEKFPIAEHDIVSLFAHASQLGAQLLVKAVQEFKHGAPKARPQDEQSATYDPMRKPEDGEIKKDFSVEYASRLVRALKRPWPGAYIVNNGAKWIIHECTFEKIAKHQPFDIRKEGNHLLITLKDGILKCTDWEQQGE